MKNVAVVLTGCGHLDGSEVREAVAVLWALSKYGARAQCFAPDEYQQKVMNHRRRQPEASEPRNSLDEAARIARGQIRPLQELNPQEFAGIALPGGMGAAVNLSTFATEGSRGRVHPILERVLQDFSALQKPIAAVCIAPAVVALALRGKNLELTVGSKSQAAGEIEKLGHRHFEVPAKGFHVDRSAKVITTPAYMYDEAPLYEIFEGIEGTIRNFLELC